MVGGWESGDEGLPACKRPSIFGQVLEETTKCLGLFEKTVEPSLDIVVNQEEKDEVFLSLSLSKMVQLEDPIWLVNQVVHLNP